MNPTRSRIGTVRAVVGDHRQPERQDDRGRRPKGFDAGKKVKGRKRHLLVDILGLLVVVFVTAASVQDRDAVPRLLREAKASSSRLTNTLVDGAYTGDAVANASKETGICVTMVKRPDIKGFVVVRTPFAFGPIAVACLEEDRAPRLGANGQR